MAGGGPSSLSSARTELWHRIQKVSRAQPASWCDMLRVREGTYSGSSWNRCRLQTVGHGTAKTATKLAGSPSARERGAVPMRDAAEGTIEVTYMYILGDAHVLSAHGG